MVWNADRSMYFGTKVPDPIERVELRAQASIHWLKIEIAQNIAVTALRDEKAASTARSRDGE